MSDNDHTADGLLVPLNHSQSWDMFTATDLPMNIFNSTMTVDNNTTYSNSSDTAITETPRSRTPMSFPWANPLNVITKETSDDITKVLQCYIFPVVTLIGLTGNFLSLLVLVQRKMRASITSIVLIGLAVADIMFLITNAVRKSTCIIRVYDNKAADTLNATTFYYMFYLKTAFSRVSTMIVVLISLERLVAVAYPLKIKTLVTRTRMILAVIFCYIVVFGGLAALPPQYTYKLGGYRPMITMTEFAIKNADSLKIYNEYFLPIAFRHIPVFVVLIVNSVIILLLGKSKRFQKSVTKQDSSRSDEQKKITRMLLSVAIVFLICLLPGDVLLITSLALEGFQFMGMYHNIFMVVSDLCLLFEMVNSCANFIIYMLLNKNFYNTFARLFCCGIKYFQSRDKSITSSSKTRETMDAASIKVKSSHFSSVVNNESSVSTVDNPQAQINQAYEQ